MSFADILLLILIAAAFFFAVRSMIRSRKKGGCGCSGCAGCTGCSSCGGDPSERDSHGCKAQCPHQNKTDNK